MLVSLFYSFIAIVLALVPIVLLFYLAALVTNSFLLTGTNLLIIVARLDNWLCGGYNYDSTPIRLQFYRATTIRRHSL